jgi:hypothetical protein
MASLEAAEGEVRRAARDSRDMRARLEILMVDMLGGRGDWLFTGYSTVSSLVTTFALE